MPLVTIMARETGIFEDDQVLERWRVPVVTI